MPTTYTAEDLAAFDLLQTPVWVVDLEVGSHRWGNLACVKLWHARDRPEMLARSTASPPSEASRTRIDALRRKFERGETSLDRWTLYPSHAPPFVAECRTSGILFADRRGDPGRLAMLVEARVLGSDETDPHDRRGVEALRYLAELVALHADDGEALMRNPAAVRLHGDPGPGDQFAAALLDPDLTARARASLRAGQIFRADVALTTPTGTRWYDTVARPSVDPVTARPAILLTQSDVTERRAEMLELEHSRTRLAEQAQALRVLAAPVIRVGPGVLALPLIGRLDRARIDVALATLLARAGGHHISHVVLDLTGAELDHDPTHHASDPISDGLLRIVRILRLQGMRVALSGIGPELATAIVHAGLDLTGLECFQNLADALKNVAR